MIRHNGIKGDFSIRIMQRDLFNTLLGISSNIRQQHHTILDFTEKMFTVFCADSDEIGTAIVIMPPGTGGFYSVFILE